MIGQSLLFDWGKVKRSILDENLYTSLSIEDVEMRKAVNERYVEDESYIKTASLK